MADEFLSGVQIGGNLANLGQMRAERMMQLRAQQAMQAVQERHLAAQADMLAYNLQQAQEEKAKEDRDLATYSGMKSLIENSNEDTSHLAGPVADDWLLRNNPKLALKVGNARMALEKPELGQEAIQSRLQGQLGVQQLRNVGGMQRVEQQGQNQLQVQGLRNAGQENLAKFRASNPRLDSFSTAWEGYQRALATGDEEAAKTFLSRVQKLSGQLPSAAMREGEDLAMVKSKLDQIDQQMKGQAEIDPAQQKERSRLQAIVDSMESRHGQEEITVSTPGGPEVRVVKGGKKEPGALTPAETTRYGEDAQATSNALRNLNRLRDQMGAGTVGAGPTVENFIFDKVLGQLAPEMTDKARIAGRQNIRLGTQQVLGELNNRGRLSNQELQAIKDAMPSLGLAESDPNAKVKLDELRLMLAEKGAAASVAIKRPVSEEILQTLAHLFPPGAEGERAMAAEVRNGSLNRDVALQVRKWQKSKGL